jgi:hypothetical protein
MYRLFKLCPDLIYGFILILLSLVAENAHADPISVSAKTDKSQMTIGDVLIYTITVQHDPDMEIIPPTVNFKGFDFIESGIGKAALKGQEEYWFRLRADETGSIALDPVTIHFKSPDLNNPSNKITGQALTPKVLVEVQSVLHLQGEPKDIRDIKSIIPMPGDWSEYYKYGIIIVAIILICLLLWNLKRKKPFHTARILLPHEQAFIEIEKLRSKQFLEQGKIQEHYFELSEVFRRYIGARYGFPSLDWTTEEIHSKLSTLQEINVVLRDQANSILDRTDKIKFAKAYVDGDTSAEILKSLLQFIHATALVPETGQPVSARK